MFKYLTTLLVMTTLLFENLFLYINSLSSKNTFQKVAKVYSEIYIFYRCHNFVQVSPHDLSSLYMSQRPVQLLTLLIDSEKHEGERNAEFLEQISIQHGFR